MTEPVVSESRLIEDVQSPDGMMTVHWLPQDALSWSCPDCGRTWARNYADEPWGEADGDGEPLDMDEPIDTNPRARNVPGLGLVVEPPVTGPAMKYGPPVRVSETTVQDWNAGKTATCPVCGRALDKLKADGRVPVHAGAVEGMGGRQCDGRGYKPRWT